MANADRFDASQSAGVISAKGDEGEVTGSEPEPYAVSVRGRGETERMSHLFFRDGCRLPNTNSEDCGDRLQLFQIWRLVLARTGVLKQAVQVQASADQARPAADVAEAMAEQSAAGIVLAFPDGRRVALPESLIDIVRVSATELANGNAVTVLPADAVLTPAEVGELLGLSRPFVVRLLDAGEIPSERLPSSRHRRVRLADVLAFVDRRDRRREGRQRLAEAVADADLPY